MLAVVDGVVAVFAVVFMMSICLLSPSRLSVRCERVVSIGFVMHRETVNHGGTRLV